MRWRRGLAGAVLLLFLAACTGDEPAATFSQPGVVKDERVSYDDALPAEFPREFPLPQPRTVLYSAISPLGLVVYFSSTLAGDDLKRFLTDELGKRGWQLHNCLAVPADDEEVTTLVVSRDERVASVVVGYSPANAERIGGRRYTFFVSVAEAAPVPNTTATPC